MIGLRRMKVMKMMSNRKLVIMRYHYTGLSTALEDKIRDLQIFMECRNGRRIRKKYRKRYRVYMDVHHQYCLKYSYEVFQIQRNRDCVH